MIELAVVGVVMLVAASVLFVSAGTLFRADLKSQSGKMSAAVRYLHNLSVMNNQAYRLVIDLDKGEYWGEEMAPGDGACGAFLIGDDENVKATQKKKAKSAKKGERSEEGGALEPGSSGGRFGQVTDNLLTRRSIGKRVSFEGLMTTYKRGLVTEGKGAIHFFPAGYVEHAFIYIGDEDDVYTLETHSLQGTLEIHREKLNESKFDIGS